jgi:hypothetical protein
MERVVYVLGAGFSAPLGLPVIGNFLERARDQHLLDKMGGEAFEQVFEHIDRLARIKNTYAADLDNIEEILSILEIDAFLGKASLRGIFQDFIRSVISYRTPQMKPAGPLDDSWQHHLFGDDAKLRAYGFFVSATQRLAFSKPSSALDVSRIVKPDYVYDIVTANYDCVLENVCSYLNHAYSPTPPVEFRFAPSDADTAPALAKLHGSVAGGAIVPPTWSKGAHPDIAPRWDLARQVLGRAQHLRFIGYSLPEADSYVRYLLKSAALESRHLKSIDVLCLDPDDSVERRFGDFVRFRKFRFIGAGTMSLIGDLGQSATDPPREPWRMLEQAHHSAFGN